MITFGLWTSLHQWLVLYLSVLHKELDWHDSIGIRYVWFSLTPVVSCICICFLFFPYSLLSPSEWRSSLVGLRRAQSTVAVCSSWRGMTVIPWSVEHIMTALSLKFAHECHCKLDRVPENSPRFWYLFPYLGCKMSSKALKVSLPSAIQCREYHFSIDTLPAPST